ncbi:tRNA uridine-5-carboxymethylaminomethyl(34) synthesis GTPase MnmE [Helicobacter sp. 11S03491-1]|uniref:tRNA uridine-5-carboxymethylaminomethyl(34) synthesis GTPase MnmE n=1 Tax=Helicobacter sp. 11S03491-1 TaxID=1476196 RepID=UPI000BA6485B|nr:tRNA uridine-5-carboxymethylaminomethyl(34) synthesis GTPase MnmE [Helicobacter sp. 11S03491-1]PAF41739.1 tRNA uridine-5-carboxymethylaminomethyl(34) synthesis GTPase MnmE [Helicobacter sp. 11S03491-1]
MNEKRTIVAVSTPIGKGAMAIVRMSGEEALRITLEISHKKEFSPRYATLSSIYNSSNELIDEAIIIYFKAPYSYTREDVCEIQCHGGAMSARMIVETCLHKGAHLALPGEFSKRALLNGRIDFSQVNAISKIIDAKSEKILKVLAKQLKGELGIFVDQCREALVRMLSYSEVMIDYSEEDIPSNIVANTLNQIEEMQNRLKYIYEFSKMRQGMIEGYRLSIVGRPNVGKSSILNAILLYDRAIISPIAGTTRDTIEESIHVDGHTIRIVDTAGIRQTQDMIESLGIQKSINSIEESDIVLVVFDASEEITQEDKEILKLINTYKDKHCVIILNKSDLPAKMSFSVLESLITIPYQSIVISTKDSQDCTLRLKNIFSSIISEDEVGDEMLLTSVFQIESFKKAIDALQKAACVFENLELELFSYNIKDAIEAISAVTRPYDISEMFDKMFGEFCLGK